MACHPTLSSRRLVSHTSSEVSVFKPTNDLVQIFGNPALAGAEKPEDYEKFFARVVSAMKPSDAIGWLFTKDVADWSWEIRRERIIKAETIKYYQKEIVEELIKSELAPSNQFDTAYFRIFLAGAELAQWATETMPKKARAHVLTRVARYHAAMRDATAWPLISEPTLHSATISRS